MIPARFRSPLAVVICGCMVLLLFNGLRSNAGLYLQPMTQANGWSRETFSLAIALQNILWGFGGPFFGAIADRYGAGRTMVIGATLYALGFYGMSQAQTSFELFGSAGALIGFGISGTAYGIVLAVLARNTSPQKRSLVMGLGTAAGSMGQFVMLPVGQAWIAQYGWQNALILQGVLALAIIPLASVLAGRPDAKAHAAQASQSLSQALSAAGGDRSFHLLFWGYFTCGFQVVFIGLHLPAYLVDKAMPAQLGAAAIAVVGLFNIVGSLASGWLGGRYSKKYLLSGLYLARSAVIALFVFLPLSNLSVYLFAGAMGLLWLSTVPLTQGLVGQIYGLRYMGMLSGIVFFGHQIGSFLGAWLGGKIFDATGSYDLAWWLIIASGFSAAILHLPIREAPLEPQAAPA